MKRLYSIMLITALLLSPMVSVSCANDKKAPKVPVIDTSTHVYKSTEIELPIEISYAENFYISDNRIYALCYEVDDDEHTSERVLYSFDFDGQNVKTEDDSIYRVIEKNDIASILSNLTLPENIDSGNKYNLKIFYGDGYDMYISDSTGLYGWNKSDSEAELLVNWVSSDIAPNSLEEILILSPEKMMYVYRNTLTMKANLCFLTKTDIDESNPKYVINLAYCLADSSTITALANNFNRTSDNYRIIITDYSKYNTDENMYAGKQIFENDIISGNTPDIAAAFNYSDISNYAEKGLFCNLYDLFDSDESLSSDTILKCVTNASEINGELNIFPLSFLISTISGKSSNVGYEKGWTVNDVVNLAKSLPDDKILIKDYTRDKMTELLFTVGFDTYINFEKAECSFDSSEFIEVLEYLNSLPETADDSLYNSQEKEYRSYQNGNIILSYSGADISNCFSQKFKFNSEDVTNIGYPSQSGNGSVVRLYNCYAISDDSPVKEGAFEFIKYMLSDEIQNFMSLFMGETPSSVKAFESMIENNKNNGYYYVYKGGAASFSPSSLPDKEFYLKEYGDGEFITINDEDIEKIYDLVSSADTRYDSNKTVRDIIDEEIKIYFAGAKSALETAKIIQSRASLYISENY